MNAYDFDNTIYRGDSTAHFIWYCVKRYPRVLPVLLSAAGACVRYGTRRITKTQFKQRLFAIFGKIPDMQLAVNTFWDGHIVNIKPWYLTVRRSDDLIISASPEFLVAEACRRLDIKSVVGSPVDRSTGRYSGVNCDGAEKVNRFNTEFPNETVEAFYSDSYNDLPMARIARRAFFVKGERISSWNMRSDKY